MITVVLLKLRFTGLLIRCFTHCSITISFNFPRLVATGQTTVAPFFHFYQAACLTVWIDDSYGNVAKRRR